MRIVLTPQAVSDIEEPVNYYRQIDQELSARFVDSVDTAIKQIVMFPMGSLPVDGFDELRRARILQFPCVLVYQQTGAADLLVVRVLHSRRHQPDVLEN